jgi:hypothetical protein
MLVRTIDAPYLTCDREVRVGCGAFVFVSRRRRRTLRETLRRTPSPQPARALAWGRTVAVPGSFSWPFTLAASQEFAS